MSEKVCVKKIIVQFFKFGIIGAFNTFFSYSIYYIGIKTGFHYAMSNLFAFVITVFVSYLLNGMFVFKDNQIGKKDWIKALVKVYTSYAATSLFLTTVLLWLQVDILGWPEVIAPFINLFFTVPINFFLNKFWAYR